MNIQRKIAIIGAGPAGAACAVQLRREGLDPVLIEKERVGGTLRMAGSVENMPLVEAGINGGALCLVIENNLHHFGITILKEEVVRIEKSGDTFITYGSGKELCRSGFVVLACGLAHSDLQLPEWLKSFLREKPEIPLDDRNAMIIGGGDVAIDRAIQWKTANPNRCVCVLNRSETWKALPLLLKRAESMEVILRQGEIDDLMPHKDGFRKGRQGPFFGHLALHIGREERLPHLIDNNRKISLEALSDCGETMTDGLFLCGDARRKTIRHAGIAVSDGLLTALEIASRFEKWSNAND